MQAVRPERTGWRDQQLSERHRRWGFDCPAVDIDFLLLEYDKGKPIALIEYKHELKQTFSMGHPTFHAVMTLADRANIPFFAVRYKHDLSKFKVCTGNIIAENYLPEGEAIFTEQKWVKFLYKLRGYDCPQSILDGLKVAV